jgi:hypothetical protein
MTPAGDSNGTGEGAPDRQLVRRTFPHDVNPMEFPVKVGSQLAHEHHHVAQLLAAVALLASVDHAVVGEQVDESLHVHDVALGRVVGVPDDCFIVARNLALPIRCVESKTIFIGDTHDDLEKANYEGGFQLLSALMCWALIR